MAYLLRPLAAAGTCAEVIDYAHVDSGTTVLATSEGCNPPPYDVRAAIGDGLHLSYPKAPPNWFVLNLGQMREIKAIEIDWRYNDKSPDDFNLSFGLTPDSLDRKLEIRGIGGQSKYWYQVREEPVRARYVKFEALTLKGIEWTVVNRFSLYGSGRIPRLVEAMSERYRWLALRVSRLMAGARDARVDGQLALAANEETCARYHGLLEAEVEITQAQWDAMLSDWPIMQQRAYEAEAVLSFAKARRDAPEAPFLLAAADNMTKVFRHVWPSNTAGDLRLWCARNEWESGQVIVGATDDGLSRAEVSWEPLRGPVTLDPSCLDMQLVCYLKTEAAPYLTHHVGWWPDGLAPLAPFSLPAAEVQPLWVTAKIPADAPAGTYVSQIVIRPEGLPEQVVPLTVQVWDFALPEKISLPNIFSLSKLLVEAWYRNDGLTWNDLKHDYYRFWLDHRLNPTSLYGIMIPPREDVGFCLERGMNAFVIKYIYSGGHRLEEDYFQQCLNDLVEWDAFLKPRGLYDSALVYLADEPSQKASVYAEIKRRSAIIHEHFPEMRRLLVLSRPIDPDFDGFVDVWCPLVSALEPEVAQERRARGEEVWWYTVGDFFVMDRPAAEARSMPWLTWKHDLDGILLWTMQSGWRKPNRRAEFHPAPGETLWDEFATAGHGGANGIGNLVYPGIDGQPWGSIRLELLREGMEDYEYFALLKSALAHAPDSGLDDMLSVPEEVVVSYHIEEAGTTLLQHRRKLGEALNDLLAKGREE